MKTFPKEALYSIDSIEMVMPLKVGDFTDFSSSKNHAFNTGVLFRSKDNLIYPNFVHMPIAYHSRASSIVVSGTPIRRPKSQVAQG